MGKRIGASAKTAGFKNHRAGKNIHNYKKVAGKKTYYRAGNDSDQEDDDEEDEDEDEEEDEEEEEDDDGSMDSDATEDTAPDLIVRPSSEDDDNDSNDDDDDEDGDDDDDDEEDDEGTDSDSEYETAIKSKAKKTTPLPIPKKLNLPRRSTGATASFDTPTKKGRRPSIFDHALNDSKPLFPRSDSAIMSSSESEDQEDNNDEETGPDTDTQDHVSSLESGMESGTEFGDDYLLALLDQEDQDEDFGDSIADSDEGGVEEEEEKVILDEISHDGLFSSPSPPTPQPPEEEAKEPTFEDPYLSDDDDQSEISFDDDFFESKNAFTTSTRNQSVQAQQVESNSDDDDSYLWSYFFSNGQSSSGEDESDGAELKEEDSRQDSEFSGLALPSTKNSSQGRKGYSNRRGSRNEDDRYSVDESGESTDEDLSLPPPSHRRAGTRATEVLSSSNQAARPPVLGTWVMNAERPFGIIDGLTTRTLSPPMQPTTRARRNSTSSAGGRKRQRSQTRFNDNESDLSELALDEFIYTSELDDSAGEQEQDVGSTPWNSRINSDVPLSAFRNRGVQYGYPYGVANQVTPVAGSKKMLKSRRPIPREAVMTPVRGMKRRDKKRRRSKFLYDEQDQDSHNMGATDLIDELVEIGALSPLFSGLG